MNDPNGVFLVDGRLHLTYQHNPDAPEWGRMHWGHADTADLVTWRHLPPALSPDPDGPDSLGCWSGCVVDGQPEAQLLYTGVRLEDGIRRQAVCRATSHDPERRAWRKDPANPLIDEVPPGIDPELFRDPFVWRADGQWSMLLGAGTTTGHGAVLRYDSPDLRAWTFRGTLLHGGELDPVTAADGPMWECPQLLRIDGLEVLVVSVVDRAPGIRPSHVSALVGRLDGSRFSVDHVEQLGMGPDFYAPATMLLPDGRWLMFGWVPEDPPGPETDRRWAGALTFPRIISLGPDGRLSVALAGEVAALRGGPVGRAAAPSGVGEEPVALDVPDGPFEVVLEIEPSGGAEATLALRDGDPIDPLARITYRADDRRLAIARRGIVGVAGRSSMSSTSLPEADGPIAHLRLLVDGSILELETNGHTMATVRLPPQATVGRSMSLASHGGPTRLRSFQAWPLVAPAEPPTIAPALEAKI